MTRDVCGLMREEGLQLIRCQSTKQTGGKEDVGCVHSQGDRSPKQFGIDLGEPGEAQVKVLLTVSP